MIAEEVQEIFVERTLLVRQENIARRNYKLVNWLKLLTLHQQDKNDKACADIISNEIHENFVMQEGFWISEATKRFAKDQVGRQDIELAMLSIDDGAYHRVSTIIADKVVELYRLKKLSQTFCLSVLEKFIAHFAFETGVADFFKKIRQIYQEKGETKKIRASFEREIKLAHDNFDLVWDQYKLWETDQKELKKNSELYEQAKVRWEGEVVQFDEDQCSQTNVKLSLFLMQNSNQSKIDQKRFMLWVQKLPTEAQKLWFLRRIALNFKQLLQPYLIKLQYIYSSDEQSLIKKYKIVIRLSENSQHIQLKYLHFLARRISKHLLNQPLEQNYNDLWPGKVVFFREEVTALIQKQRVAVTPQQTKLIFKKYYKLWIDVQAKIIKDKDSVSQLYENLIRQTEEFAQFQNYADTLLVLGAPKQAKNVLKRYMHHLNNQRSRQLYLNFIEMYGTAEDQSQYYRQLKPSNSVEPKTSKTIQVQQSDKANEINHNEYLQKESKGEVQEPESNEQNKLKRERTEMKDESQLKVEAAAKKRIHVDGENTVYVKGIPTDWTEEDVRKILNHPQPEVAVRISLVVKNSQQKDYCYVQYNTKEMAEDEVKNNKSVYKFYISRPPSDYDQSSTLFLCALPLSATHEKIRQLFKQHADKIKEIRLKLNSQKNYAYVEFSSPTIKQQAFQGLDKLSLLIDGKKILVQHCDSSKSKTKKFSHVAFLKNLAFKATVKDVKQFFAGKELLNVSIPTGEDHRPKGFAYVEFQNEKDLDQALQMKKGVIHARQFSILRSDREITTQRHHKHTQRTSSSHQKGRHENSFAGESKRNRNNYRSQQRNSNVPSNTKPEAKDNSYFSSLFK